MYIISSTLSLELLSLATFASHKLHICCFPADVFMLQFSRFEMPHSHSRSLWNKEILWNEMKVVFTAWNPDKKIKNNWRFIHTERGNLKLQRKFFHHMRISVLFELTDTLQLVLRPPSFLFSSFPRTLISVYVFARIWKRLCILSLTTYHIQHGRILSRDLRSTITATCMLM